MSLTGSYTFVGHGNWSLDAVGGTATHGGTLTAHVPVGSHVEKAFLYSATYFNSAMSGANAHLNFGANTLDVNSWVALGTTSGGGLQSFRADVTGFVSSIVGAGSATDFDFNISNVLGSQTDGYVLAVVYSNPNETSHTIALLDGFSANTGDNFTVNFAHPIDTTVAGFSAEMSLGIGFSFQGGTQYSQVDVNGQRLTTSAGGQDDGIAANGGLITVGGLGDSTDNPINPNALPTNPRSDDELYNLANGGFIHNGDTTIQVNTLNPSNDDNIFFAGFNITAVASVNSNGNDAPIAVADGGTGFITTESTPLVTASVLANDSDPDGDPIHVSAFDTTGTHGTVTMNANGTFNYDPGHFYDYLVGGETAYDVFTYTLSDGDKTSTAEVIITINGSAIAPPPPPPPPPPPTDCDSPTYIRLSPVADTADYHTAHCPVFVMALSGNDIVTGSKGADSLNGADGNDQLHGGAGRDVISGGKGQDRVQGGADNDTFVFRAGDLMANYANADHIIDFHGAGGYLAPAPGEDDFIGFFGFGAGTTITYDHASSANAMLQYYKVVDPTNHANDGFILVQMSGSTTHLAYGDYKFFG